MILILMGVSGCGKTTVSKALSEKTGWEIAEADDFHPSSNKSKMAKGIPLCDEDRLPWLVSLHEISKRRTKQKKNLIMTCSALKKSYRNILVCGETSLKNQSQTDNDTVFVHLYAPIEIVQKRISSRSGHFMPSSLLQSQFETLEHLTSDEKGFLVSSELSEDDIVNVILEKLNDK